MADDVLILTIALPLATALASAAVSAERVRRGVSVAGSALLLAANSFILYAVRADGIQVAQIGGWPAPHGITLVADHLSGLLLVVASAIGLVIAAHIPSRSDALPDGASYTPFVHVLTASVCGALVAGDLFNLYVWFELMLITSFVLMILGDSRGELEGAMKYAITNIAGSVFFLAGIGIVYGLTGTLNLADLGLRLPEVAQGSLASVGAVFFILAFGIKAGAFPLNFWLPASYPAVSAPVGALFAGLLTKVGVYAMIRMFTLVFIHDPGFTHTIILWMGGATMVFGVAGALVQQSYHRLISYLLITAVGFMMIGLGMYSTAGLTGSVFYLLEDAFAIATLFLLGAAVPLRAQNAFRLGGFYERTPTLAFLFFIPAFSLAGFPPLAGFWSKVLLARAGLDASAYVVVALLLVTALLILVAVLRVWFARGDGDHEGADAHGAAGTLTPAAVLAGITILITVFAGVFVEAAATAADGLMRPETYIERVLHPD